MTKKKTFKPVPPALTPEEAAELLRQEKAVPLLSVELSLVDRLAALKGMTRELAEHMVTHGVPKDAYVIQTFYRIPDSTAREVLNIFMEEMK